jgi:uncharacterized membrane protein YdfJ with MMPL/SSD domain
MATEAMRVARSPRRADVGTVPRTNGSIPRRQSSVRTSRGRNLAAGQYAIGSAIFNGIASGTIAVVAFAVAGSVTVLPAVLELLGPRIDRGRIPFLPHLRTDGSQPRFWPAVIDRVLRRPLLWLLAAAGLLIALAEPALGLHISEPSSDTLKPQANSAVTARMHADFPGTSEPALVVVTGPWDRQARVRHELKRLEGLAAARGIAHPPFTETTSSDGQATAVELPLTGLGDNAASRHAISVLRNELNPPNTRTHPRRRGRRDR